MIADSLQQLGRGLVTAYRRTGADLPFGDPLPSHGTEMEGWFWRISDRETGRVVVALCSENRHPDGSWSTAAIALHPGGIVRSAAIDGIEADRARLEIHADHGGNVIEATERRLHMTIGDADVDVEFDDTRMWPKIFAGGGVFSTVPFLNQYWHPYRLGGRGSGVVTSGDQRWVFSDAAVYCERNWGAGFPLRWWWGQAHDFGADDVCVVFSGGVLEFGPLQQEVTGIVIRLGDRLLHITPPAPVRYTYDDDHWHLSAQTLRYQIELDGVGHPDGPHVLPVPLPAERRNIDTDYEHLAGTLRCTVREWGRVIFDGTSSMAGLEIGSRPE